MLTICPHCERPTVFVSRSGDSQSRKRPDDLPRNIITAVTADGTCTTCWRATKGQPRPSMRGMLVGIKYPTIGRAPLTDEQIEQARQDIERFWEDRRRRGIHPEGAEPALRLRA